MVFSLDKDTQEKILQMMTFIRMVEEKIAIEYPNGEIRCPTHLSIGQELTPAIYSVVFNVADQVVSTHRGHAHYLAKGGNLQKMIAELYGKKTGCSLGLGGSMHLIDINVGFMGTSAIVGNSIPIGVGIGLSNKLAGNRNISTIFLGDAATEQGVFIEALNFAVVAELPVLFIVENNLYSVYSGLDARQPKGRSITSLSSAVGAKSFYCPYGEISNTFRVFSEVEACLRKKSGPVLIEVETYRWREHCGPFYDLDKDYRRKEEFDSYVEADPLASLHAELSLNSGFETRFEKYITETEALIADAFEKVKLDDYLHPSKLSEYEYAQ